jgi:hypothetical protein
MPSSTSSSRARKPSPEAEPPGERPALPQPGLRLTAADRPGVAQPVPERDVPPQPWKAISLAVLVMTLVLTGLWEWRMRTLGLTPGDLPDGPSTWAEQRRRIDAAPTPVAIVGDSRILFDTDLDRFQQLTGVRPIQLALPGTNGRPFLEDLADDPKFKGLAIVGLADISYFRDRVGLMEAALKHGKWESPSDRISFQLRKALSQRVAMIAPDYRLSTLVLRLDPNLRKGVEGPYDDVWKISQGFKDRQTFMWPRIETDAFLRDHARIAWDGFRGPMVSRTVIASTQARTRVAVAKIRARGGDVIFVRPPSAPPLRVNEDRRLPRSKGFDALLAAAGAKGIHVDDLPNAQGLVLPEWSHLSRACARVFTDAYVRRLTTLTPRLRLKEDAPPPLTPADCRPGAVTG